MRDRFLSIMSVCLESHTIQKDTGKNFNRRSLHPVLRSSLLRRVDKLLRRTGNLLRRMDKLLGICSLCIFSNFDSFISFTLGHCFFLIVTWLYRCYLIQRSFFLDFLLQLHQVPGSEFFYHHFNLHLEVLSWGKNSKWAYPAPDRMSLGLSGALKIISKKTKPIVRY